MEDQNTVFFLISAPGAFEIGKRYCHFTLQLAPLLGSGPEGVDDLCFHTYGEFSPPGIGPLCWDLGLEDGIWASNLGSGTPGHDFGL